MICGEHLEEFSCSPNVAKCAVMRRCAAKLLRLHAGHVDASTDATTLLSRLHAHSCVRVVPLISGVRFHGKAAVLGWDCQRAGWLGVDPLLARPLI
jgi:hypothetical protein